MGKSGSQSGSELRSVQDAGGTPLAGQCQIQGAKNAVLPLLAAGLLCDGGIRLDNCPRLKDIDNMLRILQALGCKARWDNSAIELDAGGASSYRMPRELSKQMRSSIGSDASAGGGPGSNSARSPEVV